MKKPSNVVDLDVLYQQYDSDLEIISELINVFLKYTPEEIKQIQLFYEQKNWHSLGKLTHNLKPKYSLIGIKCLKNDINKLHQNVSEEINIHEIPNQVKNLVQISEKAFTELNEELARIKNEKAAT